MNGDQMEFTFDEKIRIRILIGILMMILLVVFSLIFTDFSHTCEGAIFYALCIFLFIIISIYLIKDKPRIEKIFPFFILLFMLITTLLRIFDKCYCDLHISDNDVYILKRMIIILFEAVEKVHCAKILCLKINFIYPPFYLYYA